MAGQALETHDLVSEAKEAQTTGRGEHLFKDLKDEDPKRAQQEIQKANKALEAQGLLPIAGFDADTGSLTFGDAKKEGGYETLKFDQNGKETRFEQGGDRFKTHTVDLDENGMKAKETTEGGGLKDTTFYRNGQISEAREETPFGTNSEVYDPTTGQKMFGKQVSYDKLGESSGPVTITRETYDANGQEMARSQQHFDDKGHKDGPAVALEPGTNKPKEPTG